VTPTPTPTLQLSSWKYALLPRKWSTINALKRFISGRYRATRIVTTHIPTCGGLAYPSSVLCAQLHQRLLIARTHHCRRTATTDVITSRHGSTLCVTNCRVTRADICAMFFSFFLILAALQRQLAIAAYCCTHSSVVGLSVCVSVGHIVIPVKTAKPIEIPVGKLTRVGQCNHVLDGNFDPPRKWGQFLGLSAAPMKSIGSLCSCVRENGWTDRDVVWNWFMWAQGSIIRWGQGRRICSPPRIVTIRRCGILSKFLWQRVRFLIKLVLLSATERA